MLVEPPPGHNSKLHLSKRHGEGSERVTSTRWRADLAALRQLLTGESVVDLGRWWFTDRAAVDEFLCLHQFDTDNPLEIGKLRDLHHEAVEYLTETQGYSLPEQVEHPNEIHDLFLQASSGTREIRNFSCMLLKVMNTLHHINGREVVFGASISEAQLLERLSRRVFTVIDEIRASGVEVVEFSAGKKRRASLVTKLLAKRDTLATQIFDRLRFSITVKNRDDIVKTLLILSRRLIPFNYVVPGQSQNGIIMLGDIAQVLGLDPQIVWEEWTRDRRPLSGDGSAPTPPNEFSGRSYRCVNIVSDIPLRIDDVMPNPIPTIAFAQTEVQVVDLETARANEEGENAHSRYKKRQHQRVRDRLERPIPNKQLVD